ncbi:sulfotransferase [Dyella subtropica]|uniref:sulfotransferase n=1 Tax=Dyella subtropica TaxID=2992127 RepID=UPI002255D279|nr:sulfotransferase [Dyella subtropica]
MTACTFVGVTGLPRAGSTLSCQLLAQHPEIQCEGHSSPLCNTLLGIRRMISDDQFFLSQLDSSFETSYAHLASAMKGFLRGWHQDSGTHRTFSLQLSLRNASTLRRG